MPHLQKLWSELSDRRDDVVFLCINKGDEPDVIEKYWKENGFTLRAVRQEGTTVSKGLGVKAYPTNYVIGPDGKVIYRGVAYFEDRIREAIQSTRGG